MIIDKAKLSKWVIRDVEAVIGSMYRLNSPGAIGYLFNKNSNGRCIARGMFCDSESEKSGHAIERSHWAYYLDFSTGILEKIY